jgi:TrpR-related protein YerC/YecD
MSENPDLFEAISMLSDRDEAERFFHDLCTPQEIKAMKERWKICKALAFDKLSYREIRQKFGVSTTTVTRVARFLSDEPCQGYRLLLEKIKKGEEQC